MPEEEIIKSAELPVEETHEIKPIDKAKEGKMAEVSPSFDSALSDKKPAISAPISIKTTHSKKNTVWHDYSGCNYFNYLSTFGSRLF